MSNKKFIHNIFNRFPHSNKMNDIDMYPELETIDLVIEEQKYAKKVQDLEEASGYKIRKLTKLFRNHQSTVYKGLHRVTV